MAQRFNFSLNQCAMGDVELDAVSIKDPIVDGKDYEDDGENDERGMVNFVRHLLAVREPLLLLRVRGPQLQSLVRVAGTGSLRMHLFGKLDDGDS